MKEASKLNGLELANHCPAGSYTRAQPMTMANHFTNPVNSSDMPCLRPRKSPRVRMTSSEKSKTFIGNLSRLMCCSRSCSVGFPKLLGCYRAISMPERCRKRTWNSDYSGGSGWAEPSLAHEVAERTEITWGGR